MKNKIEDLRDHLFATIEGLTDKDNPMDLERAKMIGEIAQTLINSAKAEVEFLRVTGAPNATDFIPQGSRKPPLPGPKR